MYRKYYIYFRVQTKSGKPGNLEKSAFCKKTQEKPGKLRGKFFKLATLRENLGISLGAFQSFFRANI